MKMTITMTVSVKEGFSLNKLMNV